MVPEWVFQSTLSVRRATARGQGDGGHDVFQSTLSVRRATLAGGKDTTLQAFQSTLSVRRATDKHAFRCDFHGISIHALREESDVRPVRRSLFHVISIHALREESDVPHHHPAQRPQNFNPRSP